MTVPKKEAFAIEFEGISPDLGLFFGLIHGRYLQFRYLKWLLICTF